MPESYPLLRFHWRLLQGGERAQDSMVALAQKKRTGLPELDRQTAFCQQAEACGMDSLLTAFGHYMPDSIVLATALGMMTDRIRFMIAYRAGTISPTLFVQQINTLSSFVQGRVCLNMVAGFLPEELGAYGDFLSHDARYERLAEFLHICNALWQDDEGVNFEGQFYRIENGRLNSRFVSSQRRAPEILVGGNSLTARDVAIQEGDCWLRFPDLPEKLRPLIQPVLQSGKTVGLRLAVIARPTRREAVEAAEALLAQAKQTQDDQKNRKLVQQTDAESFQSTFALSEQQEWLTPWLWTGAAQTHGPACIALVGTPHEVAEAIIAYKAIGVSQFVFSGWPKLEEMQYFSQEVLPLIRQKERAFMAA